MSMVWTTLGSRTAKEHNRCCVSFTTFKTCAFTFINKAIEDDRPSLRFRHFANSTKHNNVFDSAPLVPLCDKKVSYRRDALCQLKSCQLLLHNYTKNFSCNR